MCSADDSVRGPLVHRPVSWGGISSIRLSIARGRELPPGGGSAPSLGNSEPNSAPRHCPVRVRPWEDMIPLDVENISLFP